MRMLRRDELNRYLDDLLETARFDDYAPNGLQAGGAELIRKVGWRTGAAEKWLAPAAASGLDAFFTGEISEHSVHAARELGIHLFAAGHHATERYGVAARGDQLAQHFGITHVHIEIPNPV